MAWRAISNNGGPFTDEELASVFPPTGPSHLGLLCHDRSRRHIWQENPDGWEICINCKWRRPTYKTLAIAFRVERALVQKAEAALAEADAVIWEDSVNSEVIEIPDPPNWNYRDAKAAAIARHQARAAKEQGNERA